ncbi:CRISPR-associated helicase Cas3' [Dehalococcoidia bacterium]|nr:CRISPR-associated helicase Cas3' [Dehalococcoidia bacterium]
MTDLKSHPHLQLFEHIAQVSSAMDGLYNWHSKTVTSSKIRTLTQKIIPFHDAGKSTAAFQKYIENPPAYADDPNDKQHTPLSMLLTLLKAKEKGWDVLDAMMIGAVVFGHHKGLPTLERMREIGSGTIPKILKRQIQTLEIEAVSAGCGIDISTLDLTKRPWAEAQRYLDESVFPAFDHLSIPDAVGFRLRTQLLFSLLLEADKAFLAVKKPEVYLGHKRRHWMPKWIDQRIGQPENTAVNKTRQSMRTAVSEETNNIEQPGIFSLTAPTGSGKTLLSATWLFELRQKFSATSGVTPKAIVVLPFLSIIDQTTKEYEALLTTGGEKPDGSWFLTSHSLADRRYEPGLEEDGEHFFVDTWRTELVITTYDQFLMTLMDPRARYQMRFHNLCDALIVMDEVQSLPCKLWKPLEEILKSLVTVGGSSVLLMSATLPPIIPDAKPLIEDYHSYFRKFSRYSLQFRLQEKLNISDFCNEMLNRRDSWFCDNKRVLITLNTRRSARLVRDALAKDWPTGFSDTPLFFLSADVTPRDRLKAIETIKQDNPCIVVSTQCIEAGVDIDMNLVIRDFAPLDSLIQIAGRCNRNGNTPQPATVEIVDLVNTSGRRYSDMIYDEVHLQVTRRLIEGLKSIEENKILRVANQYFDALSAKKDTGSKHLEKFARWQKDDPVRELLRGKEREKYTFLVLEQDPELEEEMANANCVDDRWERREAWRAIAGRIAKISVDVYAKYGFNPQSVARDVFGHWILYDGFYSSGRGIVLDEDVDPLLW